MTESEYINLIVNRLNQIADTCETDNGKLDKLILQSELSERKTVCVPEKKLLDTFELCELLHISKRTLARYKKEKALPYLKIKRLCFYRREDVIRFIENYGKKKTDG